MKCPSCKKIIRKTDESCKYCGVKIEHLEEDPRKEEKVVNQVIYQIIEPKANKWLVFSVGVLSFLVLLESSFNIWYFFIKEDNIVKEEPVNVTIPEMKQIPINNYNLDEKFVFDGFELTIHSNYSLEILENKYSPYNGKEVIKVPVTIKNVTNNTNSFDIYKYKIFGPDMKELDEVAQYFDEGLFYIHDLKPNEEVLNYLYFLYEGSGKYLIKFENEQSIKNLILFVNKY